MSNATVVGSSLTFKNIVCRIQDLIDEGAFGNVYRAVDANLPNTLYALKHIRMTSKEKKAVILHEINILNIISSVTASPSSPVKSAADNNHIVKFFNFSIQNGGGHAAEEYWLLFEFCPFSLFNFIYKNQQQSGEPAKFPMPNNFILRIGGQVAYALTFLHTKQLRPIVHRDIKLENILIDCRGLVKLCDFGSCTSNIFQPDPSWPAEKRESQQEEILDNTTPQYRAPELLDLYQNLLIGEKMDVWALGCVLYLLCFGALPFTGEEKLAIIYAKYKAYDVPSNEAVVREINTLLSSKIFVTNPVNRISSTEVYTFFSNLAGRANLNLHSPIIKISPEEVFARHGSFSSTNSSSKPASHSHQPNLHAIKQNFDNFKHSISHTLKEKQVLSKIKTTATNITNTMVKNVKVASENFKSAFQKTNASNSPVLASVPGGGPNAYTVHHPHENHTYGGTNLKLSKHYNEDRNVTQVVTGISPRIKVAYFEHMHHYIGGDINQYQASINYVIQNCVKRPENTIFVVFTNHLFKLFEETFNRNKNLQIYEFAPKTAYNRYHFEHLPNVKEFVKALSTFMNFLRQDEENIVIFLVEPITYKNCQITNYLFLFLSSMLLLSRVCSTFEQAFGYIVSRSNHYIFQKVKDKSDGSGHNKPAVPVFASLKRMCDLIMSIAMETSSNQVVNLSLKAMHIRQIKIAPKRNFLLLTQSSTIELVVYVNELETFRTSKFAQDDKNIIFDCNITVMGEIKMLWSLKHDTSSEQNVEQKLFGVQFHSTFNCEKSMFEGSLYELDVLSEHFRLEFSKWSVEMVLYPINLNQTVPLYDYKNYPLQFCQQKTTFGGNIIYENFFQLKFPPSITFKEVYEMMLHLPTRSAPKSVSVSGNYYSETLNLHDHYENHEHTNTIRESISAHNLMNVKEAAKPKVDLLNLNDDDIVASAPAINQAKNNDLLNLFTLDDVPASKNSQPFSMPDIFDNSAVYGAPPQNIPQNIHSFPSQTTPQNSPWGNIDSNSSNPNLNSLYGLNFQATPSLSHVSSGINLNYGADLKNAPNQGQVPQSQQPQQSQQQQYVFSHSKKAEPAKKNNNFDDLLANEGFSVKSNTASTISMGDAMKRQQEYVESDPIKLKIAEWTRGKQKNIRTLLSTLQEILTWDEARNRWKVLTNMDLKTPDQVKIAYRKACLLVHPDKMVGKEYEELAKAIFVELNEGWTLFEKTGSKAVM